MRKSRDSIRMALADGGSLTSDEIVEHIRDGIDTDAKAITIYLTVRMMHKEGLLVKIGNKYSLARERKGLMSFKKSKAKTNGD
jgi:hypothetical protein